MLRNYFKRKELISYLFLGIFSKIKWPILIGFKASAQIFINGSVARDYRCDKWHFVVLLFYFSNFKGELFSSLFNWYNKRWQHSSFHISPSVKFLRLTTRSESPLVLKKKYAFEISICFLRESLQKYIRPFYSVLYYWFVRLTTYG